MYWNDYNDARGFIIFDTNDLSIEYINNPYEMFKIIYYDEDNLQKDLSEYENCIVKVIIKNKTNQKKYEKFFDKVFKFNLGNFDLNSLRVNLIDPGLTSLSGFVSIAGLTPKTEDILFLIEAALFFSL